MKKFLVHVHVFYNQMYYELKKYLFNIREYNADYIFTFVEEYTSIFEDIKKTFKNSKILVVPNLGYDLGPFIYVLNKVVLDEYSYIIKLHTKRDLPVYNPFSLYKGQRWRNFLLSFIKTESNFDKVIQCLEKNSNIGMHGSCAFILNKKYDGNSSRHYFEDYLLQRNLPLIDYSFVAGTIFVVRASLMKMLQDLNLDIKNFEFPDLSHKSVQFAHVIERLCGYIVLAQGYKIVDCTYNMDSHYIYSILNVYRTLCDFLNFFIIPLKKIVKKCLLSVKKL